MKVLTDPTGSDATVLAGSQITVPKHVGYARVSTDDQKARLQLDALQASGCTEIYQDAISGATRDRPGLTKALAIVSEGDTLVIWRLDRLGRSVSHLFKIVKSSGVEECGSSRFQSQSTPERPLGSSSTAFRRHCRVRTRAHS